MLANLAEKWWVVFLRGLFSLIFGVIAITFPGITLASLVIVFGAYALVDGSFTLYYAWQEREKNDNWGWSVAEGVLSILAGLAAWLLTPLVGLTLVVIVGLYAILTGITQVVSAWRLREVIVQEWLLGIAGAISIIFGLIVVVFPITGAFAIAMLIGFYAITFGIMLMGVSMRYRSLGNQVEESVSGGVGSQQAQDSI